VAVVAAADAANRAGERPVSRKIQAIMKNWAKGDRVVQPTYGAGTLVEVNEHHTVIDFDEHGRRVFATRLVALQATSEPAPSKAPRKRAVKKKKTAES
jgi:preprotein translocase subunit YajC